MILDKITLSGMEFYAYHGCSAEEKVVGTRFKVDLVLYGNFYAAAQSDNLDKAVNYTEAYEVVKTVMENPVNLLEHLCQKIMNDIGLSFPIIQKTTVTVYKLNPAIGGKTDWVSVSMSRVRKV
ncbi:MAG: dihydroneopterin aldolase [Bacteroidales bacterium]|jgi:dihydroneopterin aldolase|nr:dihydroneopterin aldolase [Bacteroidales bacterium]